MKTAIVCILLTYSLLALGQSAEQPVKEAVPTDQKVIKAKELVKGHYEGQGATYFLLAKKAAQNIAEMPLEKIESIFNLITFSNSRSLLNRGEKNLKKEQERQADLNEALVCVDENSTVDKILDQVKKTDACLCSPWNKCETKKCSCASLCPFDMRIMRKTAHQISPVKENQLHFRNHQSEIFKFPELTGFCWGHATVTQRMTQLSVFNPNKKLPYPEGSKEWVLHYKQVIDNLVSNHAQEILGFKNLYEFSGHPALEEYIALKVNRTWAKQAAELGNITHFVRLTKDTKDNLRFTKKVKEYLDFGVSPVIVKSDPGISFGMTHVVVAYKFEEKPDGSKVIYLNDNSESIESNAKGEHQIVISKDGVLITGDYSINLVDRHFKRDIVRQVTSMKMLCEEQLCK